MEMQVYQNRASARRAKPCLQGPDFPAINRAAISALPALLARWCPGGRIEGCEYVVLNPKRADRHPGSFKIRPFGDRAGAWADFATGHKGGDVISLAAY